MQFKEKKFDSIRELDGISEKTLTEHYKLYQGYVKKANEILDKLKTADKTAANQTYSDLRELKVELSFAIGGIKHHELYFSHLGGKGGKPKGKLLEMIEKEFGSFEDWKDDMAKTALAARGWVWLAFDFQNGMLFNYLGDSQNAYPVWGNAMLVALDTYEHAYWMDYGTNRAGYVEAFFRNLNWEPVEKMVEKWGIDKAWEIMHKS
ncbi:MAG: superoxide dismutase [Acidobacteriaceae bacterium]